jgi:hypothetical protein
MTEIDPKEIHTGGDYIEGNVGGDIVGHDKIIQNIQLDVGKLIETLQQALPADDPMPQHLLEAFRQFHFFHTRLFEWKELHNSINDITIALGQFLREVERLDISQSQGNARDLRRSWRPVAQKVNILLDWATSVKYIAEQPFEVTEAGMQGPNWAVDLLVARTRVDENLLKEDVDEETLYDATYDFNDAAERHMYLADKKLRETAGELYNLSRIVLGSMGHDEI